MNNSCFVASSPVVPVAGRVATYVHSDKVSPDKGMCAVLVHTQTDFASRTDKVRVFAAEVAKLAYGVSAGIENPAYADVIGVFPNLETARLALAQELKETIEVSEIVILKV